MRLDLRNPMENPLATNLRKLFFSELLILLALPITQLSALIALVIYIAAVLLGFRALTRLQAQHHGYRFAMILFVVSLGLRLFESFSVSFIENIAEVVELILDYVIVYQVCTATADLLEENQEDDLVTTSRQVRIVYLVSMVLSLAAVVMRNLLNLGTVGDVAFIAALVVNAAAIVFYSIFLYRSSNKFQ